METLAFWWIVTWLVISAVSSIAMIGKPRDVLTPGIAIGNMGIASTIIAAAIVLRQA